MKHSLLIPILVCVACVSNQLFAQETQQEKIKALMVFKFEKTDLEFRVGPGDSTYVLNEFDANMVRSMQVLKGESAIAQYGISGKGGVVIILLKESAQKELPEKYKKRLTRRG